MLVTGVDIVEVSRLEKAIERHGDRILARFFTDQERAHCDGNVSRLAGRLAVKEAVSKALGTGIGDFRWIDLEIVPDERGRPLLKLHDRAQEIASELGLLTWSVSLSHTATTAIGVAVATG